MLLGERVHPRAGGEVVGRLGAAVQHDDQRQRLPVSSRWARRACRRGCRPGCCRIPRRTWPRPARAPVPVPETALASPPSPASRPLPLKRSRKLRSASGRGGWAVPATPLTGRPRAPAPNAGAVIAAGSGAVVSIVSGTTSIMWGVRPAGADPETAAVGSGAASPPNRRCRKAVNSVSRPAWMKRAASSMLACNRSFMAVAFRVRKPAKYPHEEA